jgi:putative endonuclease
VGDGNKRKAALGHLGEDRAAALYRSHGYAVLARNWRCAAGEIDLICARGETLVVCEVKTRSRTTHGHPLEAVTLAKQRRLRRLAAAFLRTQDRRWSEVRFDVVTMLGRSLHIVEGAF